MANHYVTRDAVKRTLGWHGTSRDPITDRACAAASREIEQLMGGRRFIPLTAAKSYRWPQQDGKASVLYLDDDLLAATTLTKDDDDATAIAAADYFLEPSTLGPPYSRIEIDLSSSAFFSWKGTPQRAVRVTGRWGYSEETEAAGILAEALDASETAIDISDASLIDVGDTLIIESEQMFVTAKATFDTTANLSDTLTANRSDVTVTVTDGTKVKVGEVILIESERMLVEDVTGANLTVERAYDGTTLAAHSGALDVYAYRTLTVTRGENGTTAATHVDTTIIARYLPPEDIRNLALAKAVFYLTQGRSGWTGALGGDQSAGQGAVEIRGAALAALEKRVRQQYRRRAYAAV